MQRRVLKPHQREALAFLRKRKGKAGLYMAPGTGKTLVAIRYGRIRAPVLCVMRPDDQLTWETELELEDEPPPLTIESKKTPLPDTPPKWTLLTYDGLKQPTIREWVQSHDFGIVIADEVHSIKRWQSQRTKTTYHATRHIPKRIGMTGSPLTNKLEDVFSTSLFLDDGQTFGDHHWRFLNGYFRRASHGGWYPRSNTQERIERQLSTIAYIAHEDDVLVLPPIRGPILATVPLAGDQRRAYKKLAEDWEYEIDGSTVEVDYVIAQVQKLRQCASGFLYGPDGSPRWFRKTPKLDLAQRMLVEDEYLGASPKVVFWAAHSAEVEALAERAEKVGRKPVMHYGSDKKLKRAARTDFLKNKRVEVFIGQADTGVGMNELICANQAVYFSNSTRVVSRQQSERRIRRTGSEIHDRITYWDLVSRGTIDLHIFKALQKKVDLARDILARARRRQEIPEFLLTAA